MPNCGDSVLKYMGEQIQKLTDWLDFFLIILCSNISGQIFQELCFSKSKIAFSR